VWAALVALLAAALVVRLAALGLDGHSGDVLVIHRWAEVLAEVGPWGFYANSNSIYPALLYLYWPMGLVLDGEALDLAIKGSSIPFDLALGVLLFVLVRSLASPPHGLAAAGLYLLNPAVLIAGPMWGQIDAAGTLLFVAALAALARPRFALAAALAALGGLVKPQFGLVLLPVAVVALRDWRASRRREALLRVAAGGIGTYLAVTLPLLLDPIRLVSGVLGNAAIKPFVSVSAPNPWGLLLGYRVPDDGYVLVGAALFLAGLVAALLPLRRGRDLWTLLAVGALIVFAFYFLPTRVHERYLFPAMALLAPFAATSRWSLAAYVAMSLAFAASLLASLSISMPSTIGSLPIAEALASPASVWAQGLTLGLAALIIVWLMLRRGRDEGVSDGFR
jgi:dolichyl-phosphate-mannose-protein mannosyltransferase